MNSPTSPHARNRAVILAAGRGTRMQRVDATVTLDAAQQAAAAAGLKALVPDAAGRPFLDHVLQQLADGGVDSICIVVRAGDDRIRATYAGRTMRRITIDFVEQHEAIGTADALRCAESWCAGESFLVLNADNIYPANAVAALLQIDQPGAAVFQRAALIRGSNIDPGRVGAFAVVDVAPDGLIRGLIEKPGDSIAQHDDDWISMNLWRFDSRIFFACRDVPRSQRGEFELPLAVDLSIRSGVQMLAVKLFTGVLDLSNRSDVAALASKLATLPVDL